MSYYIDYIKEKLNNDYDVKYRKVSMNGGEVTLIYIDNMCDSKFISQFIILPLLDYKETIHNIDVVKDKILFANNIGDVLNRDDAILHILNGDVVLVFEGLNNIIFCEAKGYVKRSVTIPETEKVLKGPREGFVEGISDNISLIRKKIKNNELKIESYILGSRSNTAAALLYIEDLVEPRLLEYIKNILNNTKYEYVLGISYIEEEIKEGQFGVFDTVGHSEKPDIVASRLLQGRVAIIVDGTPNVITLPYFFIENFQSPDDYYTNKYFANISRVVRWGAFAIAVLLTALYIALTTYHFSLIPTVLVLRLATSRAGVPLPTTVEVVLMFTFFQLIKEAGLRLPQPIGQAMSIVGALILGDAAVGAGITSQSTVLIVALSSICYFLIPKIYGGITVWAIIIILFASFNGLPGFYIGFFMLVTNLSSLNSGIYPYLYPLTTYKELDLKDVIFRRNLKYTDRSIFKRMR